MKTVSKLFTAAAIAFAAVACQVIDEGQVVKRQLEVTATIAEDDESKVDYAIDNEKYVISPTWHYDKDNPGECDQIIGFDNLGTTFTFTVNEVTDKGKNAKFDLGGYGPTAGVTKLYAIYAPGVEASSIDNKTLEINLSAQGGVLDGDAPVLMCATAEVNGNKVNFSFANQTAIIGVNRFKLDGATAEKVTSMTLNGVVTEGKFEIGNDGNLVLNPKGSATYITATNGVTGWALVNGICEAGVYFAAIPSKNATLSLDAVAGGTTYKKVNFVTVPTLEAGKYYHTARVLEPIPVAKVTINETETNHYTINQAFSAANASESAVTVTLLADCAASGQLLLNNSGTGDVTLDLNGKILTTYSNAERDDIPTIFVKAGRSMTISGEGEICPSNGVNHTIYVQENSSLVINDGIITSNASDRYAIYVSSGSLTLYGGTIQSNNHRAIMVYTTNSSLSVPDNSTTRINSKDYCIYSSNGSATIAGGQFKSTDNNVIRSYQSSSTVSITGGYFSADDDGMLELFTISSSGKCSVQGGFFDRPVNSSRTGASYRNILNTDSTTSGDYPFSVSKGSTFYINKSNNLNYYHNNIAAAAKHAQLASYDVVIQLYQNSNPANTTVDLTNNKNKSITLDLNGNTITTTAESFITTSGKLIITDNSSNKGGSISSTKAKVIDMTVSSANVSISDCIIATTHSQSSSSYNYPAINNLRGNLTISNLNIEATSTCAIYSGLGELEITNNSLITSGQYGLYINGKKTVTIDGGSSFYNTAQATIFCNSSQAKITIEDSYFYRPNPGNNQIISASSAAASAKCFIFKGGYYCKMPNNTLEGCEGYNNIRVLDQPKVNSHGEAYKNLEYSYGFVPTA